MAKRVPSTNKKKKSEKTVYTYKEYVEKLRPKSLRDTDDNQRDPFGLRGKLSLQRKDCGHPRDFN